MMLLLFGWMLIGSLFILLGWARSGWRNRRPLSIWNAALVMSLGMDVHALGFSLTLYGRIEQILSDGISFATDDPLYFLGAALVIAGKSAFVWVAAMNEGRSFKPEYWYAYLALLASWPFVTGMIIACS